MRLTKDGGCFPLSSAVHQRYNESMQEREQIKEILLAVAKDCASRGPGFAQEAVVLREAADRLKTSRDLDAQQLLLEEWHNLFRDRKLYWGYDIDNPGQPFFHFPAKEPSHAGAR